MKSRNKIIFTFNSPVVLGFVALSFLVMLLNIFTGGDSNRFLFMTYRSPLNSIWTYVRFFTHVLGHSGWEHFIGNMSYILLIGPLLEEKYGPKKIMIVMAVTALATALINFIFFRNVALCGASGIVFAFIVFASFTRYRDGEIPITFILVVLVFLGQQLYDGVFVQDNISNMAHIAGGVIGAIFGFVEVKKRR